MSLDSSAAQRPPATDEHLPPIQFGLKTLFVAMAAMVPVCVLFVHGFGTALIFLLVSMGVWLLVTGLWHRNMASFLGGMLFALVSALLIPMSGGPTEYLGRPPVLVSVFVLQADDDSPIKGATVQINYDGLPWPPDIGVTDGDGKLLLTIKLQAHRVLGTWLRQVTIYHFGDWTIQAGCPGFKSVWQRLSDKSNFPIDADANQRRIVVRLQRD